MTYVSIPRPPPPRSIVGEEEHLAGDFLDITDNESELAQVKRELAAAKEELAHMKEEMYEDAEEDNMEVGNSNCL